MTKKKNAFEAGNICRSLSTSGNSDSHRVLLWEETSASSINKLTVLLQILCVHGVDVKVLMYFEDDVLNSNI